MLKALKRLFGGKKAVRESRFRPTLECLGERVVPAGIGDHVWTGAISRDWYTVGNWNGGVPLYTENAIIPGNTTRQPLLGTAASGPGGQLVNSLTIFEGGELEIDGSGNTIKVNNLNLNGYIDTALVLDATANGGVAFVVNTTFNWGSGGIGTNDSSTAGKIFIVGPNATTSITAAVPMTSVNLLFETGTTTSLNLPYTYSDMSFTKGAGMEVKGNFDHVRGNISVPELSRPTYTGYINVTGGEYTIQVSDVMIDMPMDIMGGTVNLTKKLTFNTYAAGAYDNPLFIGNNGTLEMAVGAKIESKESRQGKCDIVVDYGTIHVIDSTTCTINVGGNGGIVVRGTGTHQGVINVGLGTLASDSFIHFVGTGALYVTVNVDSGFYGKLTSDEAVDMGKGFLGDETELHVNVDGTNVNNNFPTYEIIKSFGLANSVTGAFDAFYWDDPLNLLNHQAFGLNGVTFNVK